jgi:hypothetical protein
MVDFITKAKVRRPERPSVSSAHIIEAENLLPTMEMKINKFKSKNIYKGKSLVEYSFRLLSAIAKENGISQGAFFVPEHRENRQGLRFLTGFAGPEVDTNDNILELSNDFIGEAARGKFLNISDMAGEYSLSESGFEKASPVSLLVFPVKHSDKVLAVIELASFRKFNREDELFFEEISGSIASEIIKCRA